MKAMDIKVAAMLYYYYVNMKYVLIFQLVTSSRVRYMTRTNCLPRMSSDPDLYVEVGDDYWSMCGRGTSKEETAKNMPGDQLVAEEEPVSKHVLVLCVSKF